MENVRFALKSRIAAVLIAAIVIGGLYAMAISQDTSLLNLQFNTFALLSASTVLVNLGLFIYLLRRPARTEERIWLSVYFLSLVVYAAGEMMQRFGATPHTAGFWELFSVAGGGIPVALFLFTLSYTNQSDRRYPGLTAILFVATIALAFFQDHTNIIFDYSLKAFALFPWGWNNAPGAGILLSALWFDGLAIAALALLISFRRHSRNPILRQQSRIFILATAIPIFAGVITDGILPLIGVVIPTVAMIFFTIAGVLFIYGITKYQLLAINPTIFSHTVLGIMDDAVVATDERFNVVYANAAAETLLSIKASTEKVSLLSMVASENREGFDKVFADTAIPLGQKVRIDHVDISHGQREATPIRATGSRMRIANHDVWIIVLTDITKELQTQSVIEHEVKVRTRELREARAYLVSSINSLEQGFLLVNSQAKLELTNGAGAKLFAIPEVEPGSKQLVEFVKTMAWNVDLAHMVDQVLSSSRPHHASAAAEEGSFYEVYVTPVLAGKEVLGAAIIVQDVTEQKILDRSKDEFFSIASHELRTPLTAIRGNMGMVKDYFPDAMKDESLAAMVNDTHAASIRLIEIVNDFLDSSSLEQGKMIFDLKPLEVTSLVEATTKDLDSLIKGHGNTVKLEGLTKVPDVMADEGRVRQVLYNLLSNASKYTQNGTITVSADADDRSVSIRITDTGKGISPENQKRLFHKFQQASDPLTRDDTKGTGLGLYIAKLLANNMHGDITLEHSEVGKGSTFKLVLPRAKK